MSKFLFLSGEGDGLGLALRLRQEGNEVGVWIRENRAKKNYDGLLRKVQRWEDFLDQSTIVVFDSIGGGRTADRLRARGHHVFAGNSFADQLERDRTTALGLMEEAGIKIPPSKAFRSWDAARAFVKDHDTRLVFKPGGELGAQVPSYVSYDGEDMIEMLDHFQSVSTGRPEFELQDFVKGLEISTEGWFDGTKFLLPFNHTFERKQLMNNDLGPSGGCAGNVVWLAEESDEIVKAGISRMAPILTHHEYIGPIDLNTVVNNEGVWGLEFTPRFGYDALPALLEVFESPVGDFIAGLARREPLERVPLRNVFGAALRISIPPYPSEHYKPDGDLPVRGLSREDRPHLYFYDVMLNEQNRLVSTPAYGTILAATGSGETITSALAGPYDIAKKARIPNKQFRTDLASIFVGMMMDLDQLRRREEDVQPTPA